MSALENGVVKNLEKSIDNVVSNLVGTANNLQQNQNGLQDQIIEVNNNTLKKNSINYFEVTEFFSDSQLEKMEQLKKKNLKLTSSN